MPAIIGTILTSVLGKVAADGAMKLSTTKAAATVGGLNVIAALLPGVAQKDPQAIGQLVIAIVAWVGVLWGRGTATAPPKKAA